MNGFWLPASVMARLLKAASARRQSRHVGLPTRVRVSQCHAPEADSSCGDLLSREYGIVDEWSRATLPGRVPLILLSLRR